MATDSAKVIPISKLSLKDRLSRLTFTNACKLLGSEGPKLIRGNANSWTIAIVEDVHLSSDLLRVRFPAQPGETPVIVTMTVMAESRQGLHYRCDHCDLPCSHVGAVLSMVLEEKLALGLAAPPPERKPVESLADDDLVKRALTDREQRSREEKMVVKALGAEATVDRLCRHQSPQRQDLSGDAARPGAGRLPTAPAPIFAPIPSAPASTFSRSFGWCGAASRQRNWAGGFARRTSPCTYNMAPM